ncbi:MAG: hypothetical protein H7836_09550 [Magnetococcus sp. YQC-3]
MVKAGWPTPGLAGPELANFIYNNSLRPLGIGVLIGAAVMSMLLSLPIIWAALRGLSLVVPSASSTAVGEATELSPPTVVDQLAGGRSSCSFWPPGRPPTCRCGDSCSPPWEAPSGWASPP